jgi:flagellar basal body-associated protein FliL
MNKESIIIYLILLIALIVFGVSIYNTTSSASKVATENVPSRIQVSL